MKIAIGSDEAGYSLKRIFVDYLKENGFEVTDVGVYSLAQSLYPDSAVKVCIEVVEKRCEKGIILCGTGIGMAITANKVPGIRAAVCHDLYSAERARKSNNCQVLCMGARIVAPEYAKRLLDTWLGCDFKGGASTDKVNRIMYYESLFLNHKKISG